MRPAASFAKHNARWLAAGFALFFCASFGQTAFIALAAADIRREYGLTHGAYGSLYMAATLLGALCLPRIGPAADRWSTRKQAVVALVALALAAALMAASRHVALLFVSLLGLRLIGQGLVSHIAFTALGRWFTSRRGLAVSLGTPGMNAGEALLPCAFVLLASGLGWRGAWLATSLVLLVVALPAIAWLAAVERPAEPVAPTSSNTTTRDWTRAEVLRDRWFPLLLLAVLPPALIGNTVFFHQAHLAALRHWPAALFASSFPLLAAATVLCSLASGRLADRIGPAALLPFYALPMGAACLLLGRVDASWTPFAFMALYGVSNGFSLTLFGALWPQLYGVAHLGAIRSMVVAVLVTASALGPGLAGIAIDRGVPFTALLAGFGFYCIGVSVLMWAVAPRLARRQPRTLPSRVRAASPTR
jgi:MFS family permease